MKILAIDDQLMTLTAIDHKLSSEGFDVSLAQSAEEGLDKLSTVSPDLLIVDMNLPGRSGLDFIREVRRNLTSQIPILVMSGETEEKDIVSAFVEGADDYIRKPVGLNEMTIRIKKLLGMEFKFTDVDSQNKAMIQRDIVGVVIPCYNEAERLRTETFQKYVDSNLGYHLLFVNDGSKDNTLEVLQEMVKGKESHMSVYNCSKNGGKAEAVRQGVNHLINDKQFKYFGYLDADLSTNFEDFEDLVKTISDSDYGIVGGSRINRMGANITKQGSRAIISKTINLIIQKILGMNFQDTQCGAKVMTREIAENIFQKKFLTSWLFDVEIFMRMKKMFGADKAKSMICEQPLKRWIHEDGSKLSMKDSIKILGQLFQISTSYR